MRSAHRSRTPHRSSPNKWGQGVVSPNHALRRGHTRAALRAEVGRGGQGRAGQGSAAQRSAAQRVVCGLTQPSPMRSAIVVRFAVRVRQCTFDLSPEEGNTL